MSLITNAIADLRGFDTTAQVGGAYSHVLRSKTSLEPAVVTVDTIGMLTHLYTGTGASNPRNLGVGMQDINYDATRTYKLGAVTIVRSGVNLVDFTVYKSLQAANTGNAVSDPAWWEVSTSGEGAFDNNDFVGNVKTKIRTVPGNNFTTNGLQGVSKFINSDTSGAEGTASTFMESFDSTGVTMGVNVGNTLNENYVLHTTIYTHYKYETSGAFKYFTVYNPITGKRLRLRTGSNSVVNVWEHGLISYNVTKRLDTVDSGVVYYGNKDESLRLYSTVGSNASVAEFRWNNTEPTEKTFTFVGNDTNINISGGIYLDEGFSNSDYVKLINYNGTGIAGNELDVGWRASRIVAKAVSGVGNWWAVDNQRGDGTPNEGNIFLDKSDTEYTTFDYVTILPNSFKINQTGGNYNASGTSYIAIVERDTAEDGNGTKFDLPTDDTALKLVNGVFTYSETDSNNNVLNSKEEIALANYDLTSVPTGTHYLAKEKGSSVLVPYTKPISNGHYDKESADDNRIISLGGKQYGASSAGELVTNGKDLVDTTGWTAVNSTIIAVDGLLSFSTTLDSGRVYQEIPTTIGEEYTFNFEFSEASLVGLRVGTTEDGFDILGQFADIGDGIFTYAFIASSTSAFITFRETTGTNIASVKIGNITVFKKASTLGTPLTTPVSMMDFPWRVDAGTPMFEDTTKEKVYHNVMESLEVTGTIKEDKPSYTGYFGNGNHLDAANLVIGWVTTYDSHNAMKGGVWTCPKDGEYTFSGRLLIAHTNTTITAVSVAFMVNGVRDCLIYSQGSNQTDKSHATISDKLRLKKGDEVYWVSVTASTTHYVYGTSAITTQYSKLTISYEGAL